MSCPPPQTPLPIKPTYTSNGTWKRFAVSGIPGAVGFEQVDSDDVELGVAILDAFARSVLQPTIGRRFHALLVDNGFVDVSAEGHLLCTTSADYAQLLVGVVSQNASQTGFPADDVQRWIQGQQRRVADGRWWMSVTNVIAAARRPDS